MGRDLRELSNSASIESCSILFSFRTMTSGVLMPDVIDFTRLFRVMTRLYRSFKSEVAYLPPSSATRGLRSGGITGNLVRTIHSGRLPDNLNASTSFSFFSSWNRLAFSVSFSNLILRSEDMFSRSISFSRSYIGCPPMSALKSSYFSFASWYSSSMRTSPLRQGESPDSKTVYAS